jgi:hypothetical protein
MVKDTPHPAFQQWAATIGKGVVLLVRSLLRKNPAVICTTSVLFTVFLSATYGGDFVVAKSALSLAVIWGIGAWLVSEALAGKRPKKPRKNKELARETYREAERRYFLWKVGIPVLLIGLLIVGVVFINDEQLKRELASTSEWLVPANDPNPSTCIPNGDEVALYIGSNSVLTDNFPLTVVRIGNVPTLVLDRSADGRMALSLDVRSDDNKIIVRIEKNHFTINQNNYLSMNRKDRSSLQITDQYGAEVLNARYLNPRAFTLTAKLNAVGRFIDLQNIRVSGACVQIPEGATVGSVLGF